MKRLPMKRLPKKFKENYHCDQASDGKIFQNGTKLFEGRFCIFKDCEENLTITDKDIDNIIIEAPKNSLTFVYLATQ